MTPPTAAITPPVAKLFRSSPTDAAFQVCIEPTCRATYAVDQTLTSCTACGSLLDIGYDWNRIRVPGSMRWFEQRWSRRNQPLDFSGVWRFRELFPFAPEESIVTIGEGQTILQNSAAVASYVGVQHGNLFLQYEGLNPSGSFKDNGMTAAATHARMVGAHVAACASTGNTSASLAIYASSTKAFRTVVFIGSGKIAFGKLSQALDYDACTVQIMGDFDDALARVREVSSERGIYLCNSVNPFRLEGQKSIMYRVLEGLGWEVPDWIVVPGGNLGNSSSFGKALAELKQLGLIDRIPRLAVINAHGANTLQQLYNEHHVRWNNGNVPLETINRFYAEMDLNSRRADTIASAIEINRPVNLMKCLRALETCDGVVRDVHDQEILDAKAQVGAGGFGCEPASAASVAGARLLRAQGVIAPSDRVVCILTGHQLKDPDATVAYHSGNRDMFESKLARRGVTETPFRNMPQGVENDLGKILELLARLD
ncbi:threonine synthase [Planctopirus limnophila DSM 3776]|uniref:Threonine synthase n=1 Tax=Planctopirus limnophila (strain ATCC 43296 / DSM 3776 / IFAM 1008 / Mu 290) TaxID=521674 RepID=D5SS61_PLAL2|nr:threonine synthase [Planctopirus limnophila]ADG68785.1 threonine synthase [Planctopirus limnophila DSM 3776]